MLEGPFGKFDLQAVEDIGRDLAVFGEQTDWFGELSGFVERVQMLAPGGPLDVIDLAQLEHGALGGVTGAQAAVFDDAPVAMGLAVFVAVVEAQEKLLGASLTWLGIDGEEAGSPLASFGKVGDWRAITCAARRAKNSQNRFASMKFG
jgi:hypothetical protein